MKCHGEEIEANDLPRALVREVRGAAEGPPVEGQDERERLLAVLEQTGWNRSQAARVLGMHRTTVWRKMREYEIGEAAGAGHQRHQ